MSGGKVCEAAKNRGDAWEMVLLKQFFADVRRPFGHGAGSDEMPKLTDQQTNWAIEFCMAWVKSLIERTKKSRPDSA